MILKAASLPAHKVLHTFASFHALLYKAYQRPHAQNKYCWCRWSSSGPWSANWKMRMLPWGRKSWLSRAHDIPASSSPLTLVSGSWICPFMWYNIITGLLLALLRMPVLIVKEKVLLRSSDYALPQTHNMLHPPPPPPPSSEPFYWGIFQSCLVYLLLES